MRSACSCCSADKAALTKSDATHQDRIQRRAEQRAGQRAGGQQRGDRVRQVAAHLVGEIADESPTTPRSRRAAREPVAAAATDRMVLRVFVGRAGQQPLHLRNRQRVPVVAGFGLRQRVPEDLCARPVSEPQAGDHADIDRCRTAPGHTGNQHQCADRRSRGRQPDGTVGGGARGGQRVQHTPGAGQVRHEHVGIPRAEDAGPGARRS